MVSERRVVVTGLGLVSPCGTGVSKAWDNLVNGRSGIGLITRFDTSNFDTKIAGEVKDLDPLNYLDKKDIKRLDTFSIYAVAATHEAIESANLKNYQDIENDIGVCIGVGLGGLGMIEDFSLIVNEKGPKKLSPFFIPMVIGNLAPGNVAIKYGFKGPNFSTMSACASGSHAIGESYHIIRRGDAKIMVCGGAESVISKLAIGGFNAMKAISKRNDEPQKASRPFERDRDGFVVSEGAGILIIEDLETALKRGAPIYAEIIGYGASGDAYHLVAPALDGEGMFRSMQKALSSANISPTEIDYINAHGTSTDLNDKYESMAIKRLFGEYAYKIPISSSKSMMGHMLGAAGGMEAVVSVKTISENIIHPTINYDNPDPDCDLDYVPNQKRESSVNTVLSNSFGFGGANATLIFRKFFK